MGKDCKEGFMKEYTKELKKEYLKDYDADATEKIVGEIGGFDTTPKPWSVYLVRCQNNALYCGITNNIEERIKKHNSGKGSKSCRAHGLPVKLEWTCLEGSKSDALKFEAKIKKLNKKQKEQLIKGELSFTIFK